MICNFKLLSSFTTEHISTKSPKTFINLQEVVEQTEIQIQTFTLHPWRPNPIGGPRVLVSLDGNLPGEGRTKIVTKTPLIACLRLSLLLTLSLKRNDENMNYQSDMIFQVMMSDNISSSSCRRFCLKK